MAKRKGSADWKGGLEGGAGTLTVGDGVWEGRYSFGSRFEEGDGTNPEELIGAAHAACFSMALAGALEKAGHAPERVTTAAEVELRTGDEGARISTVRLSTEAAVPGIEEGEFREIAEDARRNCPVSKALAGVDIELEARLAG